MKPILITGATGYVGGRLARKFVREGFSVRCMARNPLNLPEDLQKTCSSVKADASNYESLCKALAGVETAYYLIHSMAGSDFEERDRKAASHFAKACDQCGVQKIIYLGGLGTESESLSSHLRSRQEVGRILATSKAQVIEFRASIVLGSGSLSFEMIRSLVERLPFMVTPAWVRVPAQPISIETLLDYLFQAAEKDFEDDQVFEIGGRDVVSYGDLMKIYAELRGLKRIMLPVPVLSPKLSSLWLHLVTPIYAGIGKKLIQSIKHATVLQDHRAEAVFDVQPLSVQEAMQRALEAEDQEFGATRWCDALSSAGKQKSFVGQKLGSRLLDDRQVYVSVSQQFAFKPIQEIGGQRGWYFGDALWQIRGWIDLMMGGVGMRRGRSDPHYIRVGEPLDFWRVEEFVPGQKLRLRAEMKVPGRAWLQFEVRPDGDGSIIEQTAIFDPYGLFGRLYWYSLFPIHEVIFAQMLKNIAKRSLLEAKAHEEMSLDSQ